MTLFEQLETIEDPRVDANKDYEVAGWATVGSKAPGKKIWDVVAEYLRDEKVAKIGKFNTPNIVGMQSNPGMKDYLGATS